MSHHGNDEDADRRASIFKQLMEAQRPLHGEYPNGRLNASDDGACAVSVGHENGAIVLRFPHSLTWIGFTPQQAMDIAASLIRHARECGCRDPLTLTFGR